MATMGPMGYARKYWGLKVPIINDDNEIVRYEDVNFNKYRLFQGWGKKPPVDPPGIQEFRNAVYTYTHGFFKRGKRPDIRVTDIWGGTHILAPESHTDTVYQRMLSRAVLAFIGKGSPEDVQITLQLAARCGVPSAAGGLQRYCDEIVDDYSRLGLDCNGFVGNYLCYKDSSYTWSILHTAKPPIHGDMGIRTMCEKLAPKPVLNVDEMLAPRMFVLAMVDNPNIGRVIDGGAEGVGHVMITQAHHWGFNDVFAPVPKEYLGKQYLLYSGVEATPGVGLSDFKYTILKIVNNGSNKPTEGVATIWRDKVFKQLPVKIYPVP
jgi:hypothetical protein